MLITEVEFPAVTGQPVTERHARKCREAGHGTHTVNGEDTGFCPRCGAVKTPEFTEDEVATFERILDMEDTARVTENVAGCQLGAGVPGFRRGQIVVSRKADKARLFEAIDGLSPAQLVRFGEYRRGRK